MKKARIAAVSLTLAVAISVVWLVREQNTQSDPASAQQVIHPLLVENDEQRIESSPIESPAPVEVVARSLPASGPTSLFSEVATTGIDYQRASEEAARVIGRQVIPGIVTRHRVVQLNVAAVQRLFDLAIQNPEQLSESFDVTVFRELNCIVTETNPVVTVEGESAEMILASCTDLNGANRSRITMTRDLSRDTFAYSIRGGRADHRLSALKGEGDYALIYELDQALIPRQTTDDTVDLVVQP